jgi:hypothetical protein
VGHRAEVPLPCGQRRVVVNDEEHLSLGFFSNAVRTAARAGPVRPTAVAREPSPASARVSERAAGASSRSRNSAGSALMGIRPLPSRGCTARGENASGCAARPRSS